MSEKLQDASVEILNLEIKDKTRSESIAYALKLASRDLDLSNDELDALREKFGDNMDDLEIAIKNQELNIHFNIARQLESEKYENEKIMWFSVNFPEFNDLLDQYPERYEEWIKRAELYVSLKNSSNFFTDSGWKKDALPIVLEALTKESNNSFFRNNKIKASFSFYEGVKGVFGDPTMTYLEFMSKATSRTGLVMDLFGPTEKKEFETGEDKAKSIRLIHFMNSFESINNDPSYKPSIIKMYEHLSNGNLKLAISSIEKIINDDFDVDVNIVIMNDYTLFKGLKQIKDRYEAGKVGAMLLIHDYEEVGNYVSGGMEAKITQLTSNQEVEVVVENFLGGGLETKIVELEPKFDIYYNKILKSIEGTTLYFDFVSNPQVKENLLMTMATIELVDEYVKNNGSSDLGLLGELYDKMKGITYLFSDEGREIRGEVGILLASFIISGGLSSALIAGSISMRAGQLASIASRAGRGAGVLNGIKNAGSTARILHSGFWANSFELTSFLTSVKKIGFVGDALVLSGVQSGLTWFFEIPGEKQESFLSFGQRIISNVTMLGLFRGISLGNEAILARLPAGISKSNFANVGLLSGDMAVMYTLHCIETGDLSLSDKDLLVMFSTIVGNRLLMKGLEKLYPNLSIRLQNIKEDIKRAKSSNNTSGIATIESKVKKPTGPANDNNYIDFVDLGNGVWGLKPINTSSDSSLFILKKYINDNFLGLIKGLSKVAVLSIVVGGTSYLLTKDTKEDEIVISKVTSE